jgi:hypothetical protein
MSNEHNCTVIFPKEVANSQEVNNIVILLETADSVW